MAIDIPVVDSVEQIGRGYRFKNVSGKAVTWRNMQGAATDYAPAGYSREFALIFSDDLAHQFEDEGWTCIRWRPIDKNDPDSPLRPYFKIKLNFNSYNPPAIYIASSDGVNRTRVDEQFLEDQNIDKRTIDWCHVGVNPYESNRMGKDYKSAYLAEMVIKLQEGMFDDMYGENIQF